MVEALRGELVLGLVPPEAVRDHIRQAVEVAGTDRIGHGVQIAGEDRPGRAPGRQRRRHPFPFYRAAGVPLVLCTDDEGVSRIDLSHASIRAVQTWHLRHDDLKALALTAISASFLAKTPLPTDAAGAPRHDPALEARSDKARRQWRLELAFRAFEARIAPVADPAADPCGRSGRRCRPTDCR